MRLLAVSDEVHEAFLHDLSPVEAVQLVVACGDLPQHYLAHLMGSLDVPLAFVPGNHDADVSGYRLSRAGLMLRAGLPTEPPWPPGAISLDGRIVEVAGVTVAGLGGSLRYSDGPNQYSQRQFARRVTRLVTRQRWRKLRGGSPVDLVITHAPPAGVGDGDDPAHRGVAALHRLIASLRPRMLLHGHIHPYGAPTPDQIVGTTIVRNVVGAHVVDLGAGAQPSIEVRHGS